MQCTSPASAVYTGDVVSFGVSNAAENVSETHSAFEFTYQPTITLDHAIPSLVPTNGRKSIEVAGAAFDLSSNMSCVYKSFDETKSFFDEKKSYCYFRGKA